LGCILYELVTLKHAFDANSMKGLVLKILRGAYPAIPPQYSQNLKDLIAEMLTLDPNKRPSIKTILEKDFLAERISTLLSKTVARHEFGNSMKKKISDVQDSNRDAEEYAAIKERQREKARREKERERERELRRDRSADRERHEGLEKKQSHPNLEEKKARDAEVDRVRAEYLKEREKEKLKLKKKNDDRRALRSQGDDDEEFDPRKERDSRRREERKESDRRSNGSGSGSSDRRGDDVGAVQDTQEQEYQVLVNSLKECIANKKEKDRKRNEEGENYDEEENQRVYQDFLTPEGRELRLPGVSDRDSMCYRIEALRVYLEKQLGEDRFIEAYKYLVDNCQNDDDDNSELYRILDPPRTKFIPLIFQMIVCEDNYYSNN